MTIKQALNMNKLLLTHNFVKFFKEMKRLTPLSQCSILIHLDHIKRCHYLFDWNNNIVVIYRDALRVLENAYGVSNAVLPLR